MAVGAKEKKETRKKRLRKSRRQRSRGDGLRTCAGCGEARSPREMIRVVAGPDGKAHVDLSGKAPGRGCYLDPRTKCVREAVKRKRIGRTLRKERLTIDGDALLAQAVVGVEKQLEKLLSLARKSGRVVSGAETVHRSLASGAVKYLLVAADASAQTIERLIGWGMANEAKVYQVALSVDDLGRVLGKAPRAVAGMRSGEISRAVEREIRLAEGLDFGVRQLGV